MASKTQLHDMKQVKKYLEAKDNNAKYEVLKEMATEVQKTAKTLGTNMDLAAAMTLTAEHIKEVSALYGNDALKVQFAIEHSGVGFLDNVVVGAKQTRVSGNVGAGFPNAGNPALNGVSVDVTRGFTPAFGAVNQAGVTVATDAKGRYASTTLHGEAIPADHVWTTAAVTANRDGSKVFTENLGAFTSGHIPGTDRQDYSLYGALNATQQVGGTTPEKGSHGESLVFRVDAQVYGDAGKTNGVDVGAFFVKGIGGNAIGAQVVGGEFIYTPLVEKDFALTLKTTATHDLQTNDNTVNQLLSIDF
jgi:hypothetical protein